MVLSVSDQDPDGSLDCENREDDHGDQQLPPRNESIVSSRGRSLSLSPQPRAPARLRQQAPLAAEGAGQARPRSSSRLRTWAGNRRGGVWRGAVAAPARGRGQSPSWVPRWFGHGRQRRAFAPRVAAGALAATAGLALLSLMPRCRLPGLNETVLFFFI